MSNLTLQEQETHLNLTADDRSTWSVYSDDAVMQRKLESIGAKLVRVSADGLGKHYTLRADQITFRKGKRELSPERKAQLAARMRAMRTNTVTT